MGFTSAVGMVQYLHRRMMILGSKVLPGLPVSRELRKDRAVPLMRGDIEELATIWEVFCDDLDVIEIMLTEWRVMMEDPAAEEVLHPYHSWARNAFLLWNAPRSVDKGGVRKSTGVRLGIYFDGKIGRVGGSGTRYGTLFGLTGHILRQIQRTRQIGRAFAE